MTGSIAEPEIAAQHYLGTVRRVFIEPAPCEKMQELAGVVKDIEDRLFGLD